MECVFSSVAWRVMIIWIDSLGRVWVLQLYMHAAGANHTMASRMNVSMSAGLSTGRTDQYNLMLFEEKEERGRNTEKTRANRERKRDSDPSAFTDCDEDKQAENKETDRKTGRISG